jgi:hypothetical protein
MISASQGIAKTINVHKILVGKLDAKDQLGNLSIVRKIILKRIVNRYQCTAESDYMAGFCQHGDETSGSLERKDREFIQQLNIVDCICSSHSAG